MRKAEKRRLGVIKQAEHLASEQARGLKALMADRDRREREHQQALIKRAEADKKLIERNSKMSESQKKRELKTRSEQAALMSSTSLDEAQDVVRALIIGGAIAEIRALTECSD